MTMSVKAETQKTSGGPQECAGCGKKIQDRYLLKALDMYWHEDCLKCGCCDCRLGEVGSTLYTKGNLILCKRDYLRLFGTTGYCAACNKVIPAFEMVMRARTNVYHLECFACQQCNHRFCVGDRFFLCDNKILCEYDYEERMVFANLAYNQSNLAHIKQQARSVAGKESQIPNGMPPHSQCLPNGMPPTTGPPSCGPMNGGPGPILNNPQHLGPSGISHHQGHMNGLGGPGSLSNGPSSGPPHLPIPTPPIHTSNPNSLLCGGQNGPPPLPSSMIGGSGNSNNGIGLPPLPPMSLAASSSTSVSGVSTIQSTTPISSPQLAPLPPMSAPVGPLPPMVS